VISGLLCIYIIKSKTNSLRSFKIVRYITYDSYAISVMLTFNRLWAQISAVISCLKSQKGMHLDYLTDDLSSWWESKLKDCEFKSLSVHILYICRLIMSQLQVRKSVRYITYDSYAISVVSSFNSYWRSFQKLNEMSSQCCI